MIVCSYFSREFVLFLNSVYHLSISLLFPSWVLAACFNWNSKSQLTNKVTHSMYIYCYNVRDITIGGKLDIFQKVIYGCMREREREWGEEKNSWGSDVLGPCPELLHTYLLFALAFSYINAPPVHILMYCTAKNKWTRSKMENTINMLYGMYYIQ